VNEIFTLGLDFEKPLSQDILGSMLTLALVKHDFWSLWNSIFLLGLVFGV
jgi:hypothetical protein